MPASQAKQICMSTNLQASPDTTRSLLFPLIYLSQKLIIHLPGYASLCLDHCSELCMRCALQLLELGLHLHLPARPTPQYDTTFFYTETCVREEELLRTKQHQHDLSLSVLRPKRVKRRNRPRKRNSVEPSRRYHVYISQHPSAAIRKRIRTTLTPSRVDHGQAHLKRALMTAIRFSSSWP